MLDMVNLRGGWKGWKEGATGSQLKKFYKRQGFDDDFRRAKLGYASIFPADDVKGCFPKLSQMHNKNNRLSVMNQ